MADPKPKTCSKCDATLDTTGNPQWCKKCRAEYGKEYSEGKLKRAEARGFAAGVAAFRDCMVEEFSRLGSAGFEGIEAAELIAQAPGPRLPATESAD